MDLPISPGLLISLIIVVIGILIISKGLVIVRQSEVMVIERLGSFHRVLESGINIIIPRPTRGDHGQRHRAHQRRAVLPDHRSQAGGL